MEDEPLFIGVCEKEIGDKSDCDPNVSKIGGKPVYINNKGPTDLKCKVCSSKLYLVSQIFAPIDDLDRYLYIFACNDFNCKNKDGSWVGLRYQCDAPEEPEKIEKKEEKKDDWKDKIDDSEIDDLLKLRDVKIEVKKKKKEEFKKIDFQFPCFPLYLFEDDYDPEDDIQNTFHEKKLLKDYEVLKKEEEPDEEPDEYDETEHDQVFDHFSKILEHDPDQVVRTKFDMPVLLTTHKNEYVAKGTIVKEKKIGSVDIPKCSCGAPRVPEVQVLSTTIYILQAEKYNHTNTDGMDFGTAILYTCSSKCTTGKYMDEFILVQPPIE